MRMTGTQVRHVPFASQPVVPWRNGGGSTREVASASATDQDGFRWRVSVAQVGSDGPFSAFPGIDRRIWLLRGHGMLLDVDGVVHRVDARQRAFAFAGEARVMARLIDGETEDLNVMVERATTRMDAQVLGCTARSMRRVLPDACDEGVVLALDGPVEVELGALGTFALNKGDALLWQGGLAGSIAVSAGAVAANVLCAGFAPRRAVADWIFAGRRPRP